MSSTSSSAKNLMNKKAETFSTSRTGQVASGLPKMSISARDMASLSSGVSGTTSASSLVLNPSFVKGSLIELVSPSAGLDSTSNRFSPYSANFNSLLLASTLQSLQSTHPVKFAASSQQSHSLPHLMRGNSSLSSLQAVAGPLLIQSKSHEFEGRTGGLNSTGSSSSSSPSYKEQPLLNRAQTTGIYSLSSPKRTTSVIKDTASLSMNDGRNGNNNHISIMPTNSRTLSFPGSADDFPYLGNMSTILPPTIVNQHGQLNLHTSGSRLPGGVTISSTNARNAQPPLFVSANCASFASLHRPPPQQIGSEHYLISPGPSSLHKRKRSLDMYSSSSGIKPPINKKSTITVNVSSGSNPVTNSQIFLRAKPSSKATPADIKSMYRSSSSKNSVDIYIKSSSTNKIKDANGRMHNRAVARPEKGTSMQVISIPASVKPATEVASNPKSNEITKMTSLNKTGNDSPKKSSQATIANETVLSMVNIQKSPVLEILQSAETKENKQEIRSKLDILIQRVAERRKYRRALESSENQSQENVLKSNDVDEDLLDEDLDFSDYENTDEYEYWLRYKRILTTGPPLKLRNDPNKVEFFNQMGLISHAKKSEIEFDQIVQRYQLFEDTQVQLTPESKRLIQLARLPSKIDCLKTNLPLSKVLPSDLNKKEFSSEIKTRFMGILDLEPQRSVDVILNKELLWKGVLDEKRRRSDFNLCFSKILDNLEPLSKKQWLEHLESLIENSLNVQNSPQTKTKSKDKTKDQLIKLPSIPTTSIVNNGASKKSSVSNIAEALNLAKDKKGSSGSKSVATRPALPKMSLSKNHNGAYQLKRKHNDFNKINWSALQEFQKSYLKHTHDQEKERINLEVKINSLKEILAEKQKHIETLAKKVECLLQKKKQSKEEESCCAYYHNRLSQMLLDLR